MCYNLAICFSKSVLERNENMKVCKKCKKKLPNKTKICNRCGADVSKCKIIKNDSQISKKGKNVVL